MWSCPPRKDILHRMVTWQLAKKRQGTHKTKYRHEVAFTKKKMYQQKGTGRARHQDRAAPIFIRGGHTFPLRPRDYSFKLNRRIRHMALRMALTTKFLQGNLTIVDDLSVPQPKTRLANKILLRLGVTSRRDALIIDGRKVDKDFETASWNIGYVQYVKVAGLNVYDILRRHKLIITRESLDLIKKRWNRYNINREEK